MEKTVFLSITAADQEAYIAEAIIAREREIFAYEVNIENYEFALAAPDVPEAFRKLLTERLNSENAERAKSLTIYNALVTKIPPANMAAAIAATKLKLG